MSYVRFWHDGSDVYVFESNRGVECCGCILAGEDESSPVYDSESKAAEHLLSHVGAGHCVPAYAFTGLGADVPDGASDVRWSEADYKREQAAVEARYPELFPTEKHPVDAGGGPPETEE